MKPYELLRALACKPRTQEWVRKHAQPAVGVLIADALARRANEGGWEATVKGQALAMRLGLVPTRLLVQGEPPWTTSHVAQA
jgi:hypothetical protein